MTLEGTAKSHHFKSDSNGNNRQGEVTMYLRRMPCCCSSCRLDDCRNCAYKDITGDWQTYTRISLADREKERLEKLVNERMKLSEIIERRQSNDFSRYTVDELNLMIHSVV